MMGTHHTPDGRAGYVPRHPQMVNVGEGDIHNSIHLDTGEGVGGTALNTSHE